MLSNNSDITIWQLCFHILVWSWAVENVKCFIFRAGPISFTFVFSPFSNLLYIRYSNYCWTVHYTIQCLRTHITIQPVSIGILFYFVSAETKMIPYYPVSQHFGCNRDIKNLPNNILILTSLDVLIILLNTSRVVVFYNTQKSFTVWI